jgi:chromosomal replication initiator protein
MTQNEAQRLWGLLTQSLSQKLQDRTFHNWVLPCVPIAYDGITLWLLAPSVSAKIWIEQQMAEEFHDALVQADLSDLKLAFTTDDSKANLPSTVRRGDSHHAQDDRDENSFGNPDVSANRGKKAQKNYVDTDNRNISIFPQGFDRYTLDNFIVGPNSELAFSAANGIVKNHGRKNSSYNMNPLFIYGATGLGKTHLMVGIGKGLVASVPQLRFAYLKMDTFFHEVVDAIRLKNTEPLRRKYQSVDVLLLDDIQVLRKMERSQEEIFYIFEHLLQHEKQIVITSDNSPDRLEGLPDRLITRCKWGLIVDLQSPDFETRLAILKKKLEDKVFFDYPTVPDEVLSFIANKAKASVRDLEGLLTRVMFQASFLGSEVTLEVAQEAYRGMTGEESSAPISLERICKATAESFGISFSDLMKKKSRQQDLLLPRQAAMYLARELASASYVEIGRAFNNMHHSTVMNAINSVKSRMQKDAGFNKIIKGLLNSIA